MDVQVFHQNWTVGEVESNDSMEHVSKTQDTHRSEFASTLTVSLALAHAQFCILRTSTTLRDSDLEPRDINRSGDTNPRNRCHVSGFPLEVCKTPGERTAQPQHSLSDAGAQDKLAETLLPPRQRTPRAAFSKWAAWYKPVNSVPLRYPPTQKS